MDKRSSGSGVGVLDKAVLIMVALEKGPLNLAALTAATGLPRPTAHRLAVALEHHRLVARDASGAFVLGPRLGEIAGTQQEDQLVAAALPILHGLCDLTGASAQLYRRQGDVRVCVAAAEPAAGLRDTVPVGSVLPMKAGSAAQVLLAWEDIALVTKELQGARFSAAALAKVRFNGWAQSVGQREPGVASVSAPVRANGTVVAAISISGPIERLSRTPGANYGPAVKRAALKLSESLRMAAAPM